MKKADQTVTDYLARYQPLVWRIARAFCEDEAQRDDLVQEINISLWRVHGRIPADAKEFTYVYRVAFNRAVSVQRKSDSYLRHLQTHFRQSSRTARQHDSNSQDDRLSTLYESIRELDESDRTLILLSLDRCSYSEMSAITGLNETTVGKRLSRARKTLGAILKRKEQTNEP